MNDKKCAVAPPKETISSIVTQLIDISRGIENDVDSVGIKLFGPRPCDETNEPVIGDLESALHLIRDRLGIVAKKVYTIDEGL